MNMFESPKIAEMKESNMGVEQPVINFLRKRRSVTAKNMVSGKVKESHLQQILEAGIRVPDHGALKPWRLVVIAGKKRELIDRTVILPEFCKKNPEYTSEMAKIEGARLQRADVVIAVLSCPKEHKSIPEWEMHLSAGAVCTTLLYAAQSFGYAAQWLTEWYAYNEALLKTLGGSIGKDKIAGFIYIGEKIKEPNERTRPDPQTVICHL